MCILLAGAVFSPDYAARLRRGERAMPLDHTAVNLALYRGGRNVAWVMSEYAGAAALGDEQVSIGNAGGGAGGGATLTREPGGGARIVINDRRTPFMTMVTGALGGRIEGEITVEPLAGPMAPCVIAGGDHTHAWQALAPRARVKARFSHPSWRFESDGYFDRNHGDGRLEDAFSRWGWARFHGAGVTTILYACTGRGGERRVLAARCPDGATGVEPQELEPAPEGAPRPAGWGLEIPSRFGAPTAACAPTFLLERSPFYARYGARLDGEPGAVGLGEWLDLDRFRSRWHQFLLRFKTRSCPR